MNVKTTLLPVVILVGMVAMTAISQAQVIGTYRPLIKRYSGTLPAVAPGNSTRVAANYPVQTTLPQTTYYTQPAVTPNLPTTVIAPTAVYSNPTVVQAPLMQTSYTNTSLCDPCAAGQFSGVVHPTAGYAAAPATAYYQPQQLPSFPVQQVAATQPTVAYAQPVAYQPTAADVGSPVGDRHYVGRSLWGSPKVYGNWQPLRNTLRFLGP